MKPWLLLIALCFGTLSSFAQKSTLKKASPFSAVKWEKDQPVVQFENDWYYLIKLENFEIEYLLEFCKKQFGAKWQKRFSEDLVEVLQLLGHAPQAKASILLSRNGILETHTGHFTTENRNRSVLYNRNSEKSNSLSSTRPKITVTQALADLAQFEEILTSVSSYSQLSRFDYKAAIRELSDSLRQANNEVDIDKLTNVIGKIMAKIGDRHSSVKNESSDKRNHQAYNLRLPFALATLHEKIIALKKDSTGSGYNYYFNSHPYVKSINGLAVEMMVNTYNYKDAMAPAQARLARGSMAIQKFGRLSFENNIDCPDSVKVIFSDGSTERSEVFPLTTENTGYSSTLVLDQYINRDKIYNKDFSGLIKVLKNDIGYINIPEMYHYDKVSGFEDFIKTALKSFSKTQALIIDVRDNPGGGREILQTFAGYIIQPKQSPWVANIAYLRSDVNVIEDKKSMDGRYLYNYNSRNLSDKDRMAIKDFSKKFLPDYPIDTLKFSEPFYMVLRSGTNPYTQPVYILANEQSFSAASIFVSAFKGLPNVRIVGETTDGSSGNSRTISLDNSHIMVTVSTMLSFQRNGKTLDGNGTLPDIVIQADEKQVLTGVDSQLDQLLKLINGRDNNLPVIDKGKIQK